MKNNDLVSTSTIDMGDVDWVKNFNTITFNDIKIDCRLVIVLAPERREKLVQLISENENVSRTSADYIVDLVLNSLTKVMV